MTVSRLEKIASALRYRKAATGWPQGLPYPTRNSRGSTAEIEVADHGIGIPPDDLPALFERFHRGRNVDDRRFAGMGLGLYICRGIVEEHCGSIRVQSTLGRGSTFPVELPLAAVPAVAR